MRKHLSILNDNLKYLIAALLIVVPLYPKFPFINIPGTYVSIRLEDFLVFISAVVVAILVIANKNSFFKDKFNRLIFLFLGIGLISFLSGSFLTKTVDPRLSFLHYFRRIEYFIPMFLGYYAIKHNRKDLSFFVKTIIVVLFFVIIYGLGQKYLNWPIIVTQNEEYAKGIALYSIPGGHLSSTFAGHYDLATFLILVLPMLFNLVLVPIGKISKQAKIGIVLLFMAGVWLLGVTGSRISTASYMIAITLSLIFLKRLKLIPIVIVINLILFGMSSSLLGRYGQLINVVNERYIQMKDMISTENVSEIFVSEVNAQVGLPERRIVEEDDIVPTVPIIEDRSTSIRLNVEWPRAIRALSKNPLLGTGYSSVTLATDNDYLRLFGEIGILGFLSFMLIIVNVVLAIIAKYPFIENLNKSEVAYVVGIFSSIPGILSNAMFIDVFEASKFAIIFWLLIGIAMGLVKNNYNE